MEEGKGLKKGELKGLALWKVENARMDGFGIRLVEKQFLSCLLRNDGRVVPAYREAFPDALEDVSVQQMLRRGKIILNRGRVKRYMEQMLKSNEVGIEYVLGGVTKVAQEAKRDGDKLKAYELLGKFLKLFQSEGATKNTFNLNINEDTAKRILERREKHEIGGRGDFIDVNPEQGGDESDIIDGEEEFN